MRIVVSALFALVAGACTTSAPLVPDSGGGVSVCGLAGATGTPSCAAAPVSLSPETCRCGSRWYWDGAACVTTAACTCYAGCDLLHETMDACAAAYAACAPDGG